MTDNELLLAISNIVQSYTNPIQQQLRDTETRLNNRIDTVQTHLEGRIDSVQTNLEAKISTLDDKIDSIQANLEAKISTLEAKISTLDDKIDSVQANLGAEIKQTKILLENDVLPRLQNIESCYTSTYQRYVSNVMQQETLQSDVDILKKVVTEHSKLLQKIS